MMAFAKAEVGTPVGRINLFFTVVLAFLTYSLSDKIFSQATLDWAIKAGVGTKIFLPIIVGLVLMFLMILASLFIIYKDSIGRK